MAAKRIGKSAVDWAFITERIPKEQMPVFQAFRSKSQEYLRRVTSYPEIPPAIDWSFYRSQITIPGLVDEFEKNFKALKVPYPQDTRSSEIDEAEKKQNETIKTFIADSNKRIAEYSKEVAAMDAMIPFEDMLLEEFAEYFPDNIRHRDSKPRFTPYDEDPPVKGYIKPEQTGEH